MNPFNSSSTANSLHNRSLSKKPCPCFQAGLLAMIIGFIVLLASTCRKPLPEIQASGTIEATEIKISARVGGEVSGVSAREGSLVRKGDILAQVDSSTLVLKKEQARAGVALAEANYSRLLKGARSEDIKQAEEQLVQAQENYRQAQEDYERMKKLYETNSVTQKQFDDSRTRYNVVKAQVSGAEAALAKLHNLAQPDDIKMVQAQLDQAKIQLQLLEKQVADCTVRAPRDGTITHRLIEAGEFAGMGTPLFVLCDLSMVSVTIYVSESSLGHLHIGEAAQVYIDAFKDRSFSGRIAYISSQAEFTPKNIQTREERIKQVFAVKIEVANPDGLLKAGLPADAVIPLLSGAADLNQK